MEIKALSFFNQLTEEDLISITENGDLYNLCMALSLDLHSGHLEN